MSMNSIEVMTMIAGAISSSSSSTIATFSIDKLSFAINLGIENGAKKIEF